MPGRRRRERGHQLDADEELLELARPFVPGFELIVDDLTRVPEVEIT